MRGDCSAKQEVNPSQCLENKKILQTIDCIWYPLTTRLLNRDGSRINSTCWQIYNETGSFRKVWWEHKQEWEETGDVRGVYRAAEGHSSHHFLFVLLPWIQTVVLKPDFEEIVRWAFLSFGAVVWLSKRPSPSAYVTPDQPAPRNVAPWAQSPALCWKHTPSGWVGGHKAGVWSKCNLCRDKKEWKLR